MEHILSVKQCLQKPTILTTSQVFSLSNTRHKTEDDVARHERGKVKTLRQFDLAPPVNAPNVPPPGPTVLEKLQNMDLNDLTAESVIVVQSLVIRHLKSMVKKKLPDVVKAKLNEIDGYVTTCVGEQFRDEMIPAAPAPEGI